jgi:hypothetical protein
MRAGGTLTLSANVMDGGGRAPGDPFVLKLVFYNSSNAIVNTAQLSNTLVYGATTPTTYTMSTTNCGGSCANVAYVSVEFNGKDGGYWAGNYGPYITNPSLTYNGGSNILYNPEFGVYGTNGFAQGWSSTAGWQNCALYSGAATCVINNGAPVNSVGGGYSSTGGTTSSPAGGQTALPAPTAIYMNNATVKITRAIPTTNNSPGGEGPNSAFDNNPNTKYLNFDKANAGVTVQLNTGKVVTGFTVTTANDFSGRDPTSYKLYGSNDGVTWVLIKEDSIMLSDSRFTTSSTISVTNTTAYAYYFMLFPTTKAGQGCGQNCNSMQIAELTYYYDANNTTTSTASSNNIVDPVTAANGPTVIGGTITQTNAPNNQIISSGGGIGISTDQQSRVNNWNNGVNQIPNNYLYIDQISGDYNNITVTQTTSTGKNKIEATLSGTGNNTINATQTGTNYLKLDANGANNSITSQQSNNSLNSNFKETTITGNNNTINTNQKDNANKIMFTTVTGNSNSVNAVQEGTGNHYLENKLTGNGHSILVNQSGGAANNAKIDLTNGGGAANIDLQQSGGKSFSIIQSCTNPAGCSTVIRQ